MKSGGPCQEDGCERTAKKRGYCNRHYVHHQRKGDIDFPGFASPWERWHLDLATGCWLWDGPRNWGGYGTVAPRTYGTGLAHRAFYEHFVGPIPTGLHLDHLCRVTLCVNPSHLEPVTQHENNRRQMAAITHCPQGHEYSAENTRWYNRYNQDGTVRYRCRVCRICLRREYEARVASYKARGLTSEGIRPRQRMAS